MQTIKQNNELLIIGTMLQCNKVLNENNHIINETKYSRNLKRLYSVSTGEMNLNESQIMELPNAVNYPKTKNNYAYYNQVFNFLNTFDMPLQESLQNDGLNGLTTIIDFKTELKSIIEKLDKQDSFDNYTDSILKIKILTQQPLLVCGMNLINNFALMQELSINFGITNNNLLSIVYDKYNKDLLFIGYDTNSVIKYNIKSDKFERKIFEKYLKFNPKNYFTELKTLTGVNYMFELYVSIPALSLEYSDNLYLDLANTNYRSKYQKSFIK